MQKNLIKRSKSVLRQQTKQTELSLDQILKLINPLNKEQIELEDMKRILQKIPENTRVLVQKIFHSYIFDSKSFLLETSEFCRIFDNLKHSNKEFSQPRYSTKPRSPKKSVYSSKTNSVYLDEDKQLKPENMSTRSISPDRNNKSTYVQIYQGKKQTPLRKQFRSNTLSNAESPKIETKANQNLESFVPLKSFKESYPNLQELLEIRKAHLQ